MRMREDKGKGECLALFATVGRRWLGQRGIRDGGVLHGGRLSRGTADGSPHARGQRVGEGFLPGSSREKVL